MNADVVKKNVKLLRVAAFARYMMLFWLTEKLFFAARGLDLQQMVVLEIVFMLSVALTELPTGYIADKFGRRTTLIAGSILFGIAMLIEIHSHTFAIFAFSFIIFAISDALESGSDQALHYDSLKAVGKEGDFAHSTSIVRNWQRIGVIVALSISGLVATHLGYEATFYLSLPFVVLQTLCFIGLSEPPKYKELEEGHLSKRKTLRLVASVGFLGIALSIAAFHGVYRVVDEYFINYLQEISFPIVLAGSFGIFLSLLGLLEPKVVKFFEPKGVYKTTLILILLALGFSVGGMVTGKWISPILFTFVVLIPEFAFTLLGAHLNHQLPSNFRATANSFISLLNLTIYVPFGLLFAAISQSQSIKNGFVIVTVATMGMACTCLLVGFTHHKRNLLA